jgi:predicted  nucleic acid-binding Zn-ribbon protein
MLDPYICPCRVCPRCGTVTDDDRPHPADGLAHGCPECGEHAEWWAHVGPYMDGRHIRSAAEAEVWRCYDTQVEHGTA